MPSLRSRILRILVRRIVGGKFIRAGEDVRAWRELDDWVIRNQRVPKGTEIRPVDVSGIAAERVWAPGTRDDRVILYLHGGGFLSGSPRTHREIAARMSAAIDAPALVIDYRLAPEHPFPAALEDARTAYRWLQENGYDPGRIAVGGDSAGGGLTLQLLLSLRDAGEPMPAAAFVFSPPTDWVRFEGESYTTRADADPFIRPGMCRWSAGLYVGDNDPGEPLLCLPDADFTGLPPLCIHTGEDEVLLSDTTRVADRARAAGVDVECTIWPGMWHVFPTGARLYPEGREAIDETGEFVKKRLA